MLSPSPTTLRLKRGEAVLLDPHDAATLNAQQWRVQTYKGIPRVTRSTINQHGHSTTEHLTTHLMGPAPQGCVWHHKDGNRLNYQRSNLVAIPRGTGISAEGKRRIGEHARQRKRGKQVSHP